jgi:hypothetical protein
VGRRNLAVIDDRAVPGSIKVMKSPCKAIPDIVCLMDQWDFGRRNTRSIAPYTDTKENRQKWHQNCLSDFGKTDYQSIAFPFKIGSGLTGGHWPTYLAFIRRIAEKVHKHVVIVVHEKSL